MRGWFDQENKKLGTVTLQGVSFGMQMLQLWDSHPQGRFGYIVNAAPKRARPLLNTHFAQLSNKSVMLAETQYLQGCLPGGSHTGTPVPTVLLSRFMDNAYIGLVAIPADMCVVMML